jgi:hypothetical protein
MKDREDARDIVDPIERNARVFDADIDVGASGYSSTPNFCLHHLSSDLARWLSPPMMRR